MNAAQPFVANTCRMALATAVALLSHSDVHAQAPDVVFSGTVVDLGGDARIGVNVVPTVVFQNDGLEINAFDAADPRLRNGALPYNIATGEFFLPIREDLVPGGDVSVRLRFVINGQVISQVDRLSALSSLKLAVVVPDPVDTSTRSCHRRAIHRCRIFHRCR